MSAEDREDDLERMRDRMDETRAHLSGTADALGHALGEKTGAVRERVGRVTERLDVGDLVQRHPWPAIGVAVGVGLALAATGADRAAATATADGARRTSRAAGDAVRRRRERAHAAREASREEEETVSRGGLVERITRSILHAIDVDTLVAQIRDAGAHMTRGRQPQDVSRNRLAGSDYWK